MEFQKTSPMWVGPDMEFQQARHIWAYEGGQRESASSFKHADRATQLHVWHTGAGKSRGFRNHALCGRGKTEFQQECHIWQLVGREKEECEESSPVSQRAIQVGEDRLFQEGGHIWACLCGVKRRYEKQRAMWAGQERCFRRHVLCGRGQTLIARGPYMIICSRERESIRDHASYG